MRECQNGLPELDVCNRQLKSTRKQDSEEPKKIKSQCLKGIIPYPAPAEQFTGSPMAERNDFVP